MDGTGDFSGTTTIHDTVIGDQVSGHTHGIMEGSFSLIYDHLVTTSDQDGYSVGIGTAFHHQHLLIGGTKAHLEDDVHYIRTQTSIHEDIPHELVQLVQVYQRLTLKIVGRFVHQWRWPIIQSQHHQPNGRRVIGFEGGDG